MTFTANISSKAWSSMSASRSRAAVEVEDADAVDQDVQPAEAATAAATASSLAAPWWRRHGRPRPRGLAARASHWPRRARGRRRGALREEGVDDAAADARAGPDDECALAVEPAGHRRPRPRTAAGTGGRPSRENVVGFCQVSASSSSGHSATHCPVRVDSMSSRDPLRVSTRTHVRELVRERGSPSRGRRPDRPAPGAAPPPRHPRRFTGRSPGSACAAPTRRRHDRAPRPSATSAVSSRPAGRRRPAETQRGLADIAAAAEQQHCRLDDQLVRRSVAKVRTLPTVVTQPGRRVLGPGVLGGETGDSAAQRVLVLVEVSHALGRVEAGAERRGHADRHDVVDVVGEQGEPGGVVLRVQEVGLVDEPAVRRQVPLVVEGAGPVRRVARPAQRGVAESMGSRCSWLRLRLLAAARRRVSLLHSPSTWARRPGSAGTGAGCSR